MNYGWKFIIILIITIVIVLVMMAFIPTLVQMAFAQNSTPPPVTTPTPVLTPTPTTPNPNLQYLPQKSYVQTFAPENGIPSSVPLQALPTVVPYQAPVQNNALGGIDLGSIIPIVIAAGSGLLAKMGLDKAKKAEGTSQLNAEMNVRQSTVQQKTLEQLYENMPDKGNSINDKPEIRLSEVAKVKDDAVKTASKA